jgi:hypothetical protein
LCAPTTNSSALSVAEIHLAADQSPVVLLGHNAGSNGIGNKQAGRRRYVWTSVDVSSQLKDPIRSFVPIGF